jgi:hypothetical protein
MKKIFNSIQKVISVIVISIIFGGCTVQQQVQQAKTLVNCDFRIMSVENVQMAGVLIKNESSLNDFSLADAARIMQAFSSGKFPLNFQLNLEGKNPNSSPAGMNRLEYILFLDDNQITSGGLYRSFQIPPNNGTAIIPIQVNLDLKQLLSGKTIDAMVNLGLNIAGMGTHPTRITAKIKPTIMIGNTPLTYPGYITIRTEYSGQ